MAVAKTKAAAPRAQFRPEPEARVPERAPSNQILTRDGRPVDLEFIKNQNDDRFNLEKLGIFPPQGWTYEFRTIKVKNTEYTRGIVEDAQRGWTPVPASRHPGKIMPLGHVGPIIVDGNSMLMERDERLTAMSRAYEKKAANEQLNISRSMTGLMQRANPSVDVDRMFDQSDGSAKRGTGVKIERIPMGDPQKNYTYGLDE